MITDGRTMREAMNAGNYYEIKNSLIPGGYAPPACETPEEVLQCAIKTFRGIIPGMVFDVLRITGGTIGCRYVEDAGTITA